MFKHKEKNYLFAEMYDRKKKKGVIGVARINNGKVGRFKVVLEENFHLSYPCVFECDQHIYMIPESSESHELWMYSSERFPYVWKKHRKLSSDCVADATPFFTENSFVLFATKFNDAAKKQNDNLAVLDNGDTDFDIIDNNLLLRPAGHFIKLPNGKCLRPSQNNTITYGGSLIFNEVQRLGIKDYRESPILQIYPNESLTDKNGAFVRCEKKPNWTYNGIHTYNINEDYEVIDLKYKGGKSIYAMASFLKKKYFRIK